MKYKIYNQDVIEWAKSYEKQKFHALLSDAPYHLTSITKRFGKKNSAPAQFGKDGAFQRASKGFMNTVWDGGDIAFQPETWEALCDHLYPGGFGMVFSASRNWHRLAVAIEDAGMIIHPTIFGWVQGQGFPKATNISRQLDKQNGKRGVDSDYVPNLKNSVFGHSMGGGKTTRSYQSADEQSKMWEGHRYGLQALKPAVEPIIVFQKPYEGRPLDNIVETGAGALNIDGGRIGIGELIPGGGNGKANHGGRWASGEAKGERPRTQPSTNGRWPANFILDESSAPLLDEQTGVQQGGFVRNRTDGARPFENNGKDTGYHTDEIINEPNGGASRFFYNVQERIDEADPIYYCSKVSPTERNAGLDDLPDEKPSYDYGSIKKSEGRHGENTPRKNSHPTVKPIALAKYLATLLLPPDAYSPRRILVPFSGVGSEMVGAMQAGWEQIVGIEFDTENGYVDMAHKRIEYWSNK